MLKHRIQSGVLIITVLLAAVLLLPPAGLLLVHLLIVGLATWEFYAFLDEAHIPHFKIVGLVGGLMLILGTWIGLRSSSGGLHGTTEGALLALIMAAAFLRQVTDKYGKRPLETLGATMLGVLYAPFLLNFFTKLLVGLGGENDGRLLVLYVIVVVKFCDVGAYFAGCRFGRHRLIPRISPGKSWEGCVGGVITSLAVSVIWFLLSQGELGVVRLHFVDAVVLGLLLPVIGITGDLAESLLKRAAGVKDSGTMIHGMGGVLDVLDSLLFAAPTVYIYALLFLDRAA